MPRKPLRELCEERIAAADRRGDLECTDLRIDITTLSGEHILAAGGSWDWRRKQYVDDGKTSKIIRIHDGQLRAMLWFRDWLHSFCKGEYIPGEDTARVWSALYSGGRRGGKTFMGCLGGSLVTIAQPGAMAWLVSESITKSQECHRAYTACMARQWYSERNDPWFEYTVANGSKVWQKSAHKADDIKQGGADYILLNEGQKLHERTYINARGATADTGGLVAVAANPPDTARGSWVMNMYDDIMAKKRKSVHFEFRKEENPFIVSEALDDLRDEVDDRTYAIEVGGEFLQRTDIVFYNWSRTVNEKPLPDVGDCTEAFIARHLRRQFTHVLGVDFQLHPYNACVELRFFGDPKNPQIWFSKALVSDGNEFELAQNLEAAGYNPETTALICDASADWQNVERTKGKGSIGLLRQAGFAHCYKPDKRSEANPPINERVKVCTGLIKNMAGESRLFADPSERGLIAAIRSWETKGGQPWRQSDHAHLCDAATYPLWRFFPRRRASGKVQYKTMKKFTRRDDLRRI